MMKTLEQFLFAAVAWIARFLFLVYSVITNVVVLSLVIGWISYVLYVSPSWRECWWSPILLIVTISVVYTLTRPGPKRDNPYRKYVGFMGRLDACIDSFIAWIGRIKYFTSPVSLAEDPGSYRIKGHEVRELIDGALQPGDILLRGYDGYLDGIMIGLTGGGKGLGKYFSHAALYLGELNDNEDKKIAARRLQTQDDSGAWVPASDAKKEEIRNNPLYYQAGRQMVVHSMTRGVFVEDILTFLRCDYLIVLRLHDRFKLGPQDREKDRSLIGNLPSDAEAIRASLMRGENVTRADVIRIVRLSALGKIGSCYDFQFNDIKTANRFSCSEFVYYCFKSIHNYLGLEPKIHAFLKVFFKRNTITPADIYDAAAGRGKLEIAWISGSLSKRRSLSAHNIP